MTGCSTPAPSPTASSEGELDPDAYVFATSTGRRLSRHNTATRILAPAHELADLVLLHDDLAPLPQRLTQRSRGHTYISLHVALGDDPAAISRDASHADVGDTFGIYTHGIALGDRDREQLRTLIEGTDWATTGSNEATNPNIAVECIGS